MSFRMARENPSDWQVLLSIFFYTLGISGRKREKTRPETGCEADPEGAKILLYNTARSIYTVKQDPGRPGIPRFPEEGRNHDRKVFPCSTEKTEKETS